MTDMIAETAEIETPVPAHPEVSPNRPGRLVGSVTLTLHTHQGIELLLGRRATDNGKPPIYSINSFARAIDQIVAAVELGDVYAIGALIEIDRLLTRAEKLLVDERRWLTGKMTTNPRLSVEVAVSTKPRRYDLDLQSRYAHWAARLVGHYDELVAAALSASRAATITDRELHALKVNPRKAVRGAYHNAVRFKVTGATRDDFDQANARATDAIAKHGEISSDILSGRLRPLYLH